MSWLIYHAARSAAAGRLIFWRHPSTGFKGFNRDRDYTDHVGEAGVFTEGLAKMLVRFSNGSSAAATFDLINRLTCRTILIIDLGNEANRAALEARP